MVEGVCKIYSNMVQLLTEQSRAALLALKSERVVVNTLSALLKYCALLSGLAYPSIVVV